VGDGTNVERGKTEITGLNLYYISISGSASQIINSSVSIPEPNSAAFAIASGILLLMPRRKRKAPLHRLVRQEQAPVELSQRKFVGGHRPPLQTLHRVRHLSADIIAGADRTIRSSWDFDNRWYPGDRNIPAERTVSPKRRGVGEIHQQL
jgi:hypothetical protein